MRKFSLILLAFICSAFVLHSEITLETKVIPDHNIADESFLLSVEDVFSISGRGTVATGLVERGRIKTGDSIEIIGFADTVIRSKVKEILVFNKTVKEAGKSENVAFVLSGVDKSQVRRGMVIAQPGTIKPYTEFKCEITLNKSEGSIIVKPVTTDSRRQFYFRNVDVSGVIKLQTGKELQPGATATATIVLVTPVALEKDLQFDLRESGKTIGSGKISTILK